MSINLHFAGNCSKESDQHIKDKGAYRLFSQLNERKILESWEESGLGNSLLIDSGAFSVAHSGAFVDIDDYIQYIQQHPDVGAWVELDVIPFPALNQETALNSCNLSWSNYIYMRERLPLNVTLLPLYHFGEPEFALKRILNTKVEGNKASYIGVGGRHGVSTKEQIKYFNWVFDIIKNSDNPNVKVHAFGITTREILERFPFYSADSTAWIKAAAFGEIMMRHTLYRIAVSNETNKNKNHITRFSSSLVELVENDAKFFGYTLEQLMFDTGARRNYNIDALFEWSQICDYRSSSYRSKLLF